MEEPKRAPKVDDDLTRRTRRVVEKARRWEAAEKKRIEEEKLRRKQMDIAAKLERMNMPCMMPNQKVTDLGLVKRQKEAERKIHSKNGARHRNDNRRAARKENQKILEQHGPDSSDEDEVQLSREAGGKNRGWPAKRSGGSQPAKQSGGSQQHFLFVVP